MGRQQLVFSHPQVCILQKCYGSGDLMQCRSLGVTLKSPITSWLVECGGSHVQQGAWVAHVGLCPQASIQSQFAALILNVGDLVWVRHRLVSSQVGSFEFFRTFRMAFSSSFRALCSSSSVLFILLLSCSRRHDRMLNNKGTPCERRSLC